MSIIPSFFLSAGLLFCSPQLKTCIYSKWNTETLSPPNWSIIEKPFPWLELDCGTITLNGIAARTNPKTTINTKAKFLLPPSAESSINIPTGTSTEKKPIAFLTNFKLAPCNIFFFAQILNQETKDSNNCNFCTVFEIPYFTNIHEVIFTSALQNYVIEETDNDSWYLPFEIHSNERYTSIGAETSYKRFFLCDTSAQSYFKFYGGGFIAEQPNTSLKGFYNIKTAIITPFGGLSTSFFCCDFGYKGPNQTAQTTTLLFSIQPEIILPLKKDTKKSSKDDCIKVSGSSQLYYKQPEDSIIEDGSINSNLAAAMTKNSCYATFSAAANLNKNKNSIKIYASVQDLSFIPNNSLIITDETITAATLQTKTKFSNMTMLSTLYASVNPESLFEMLSNTYKIELDFAHLNIGVSTTIKNSKISSGKITTSIKDIAGFTVKANLINVNKFTIVVKKFVKISKYTSTPCTVNIFQVECDD